MIDTLSTAHPWAGKVAAAVAVAALLGAGNTVITNKVDLVVLQQQINEVANVSVELKETRKELQDISRDLAILVDRANREESP